MMDLRTPIQNSRGAAESKTPLVITLIVLMILGFLSYKFIPVKIRNMKFSNEVQRILNIDYSREYKDYARGGFNQYTMRDKILEIAKKPDLRIPIKDPEKQVKVEWPENKYFTAEINYIETINLPIIGAYEWKFHLFLSQDLRVGKAL